MKYTARVHIFQSTKNLVQEKLDMLIAQHLVRFDDLRKICFHKIGDDIEFVEVLK